MTHDAADRFSAQSAFSAFDPRAKLIGVLAFAAGTALLTDPVHLSVALMFTLCLLALSAVPARHAAGQYLLALPVILLACLSAYLAAGPEAAIAMFLRITASVLALVLLATTTPFLDLLKGLQALGAPDVLVAMLMLTHRYIFVFGEELDRMKLARRAKAYRPGRSLLHGNTMRTVTNTAGMVLVRAYGRGLRVQDSLKARAYDGRVRTMSELRLRGRDAAFAASMALIPALGLCMQWGLVA